MTRDDDIRLRSLWAWGEIVGQTGCWEYVPSTGELLWSDNLLRIFGLEAGAAPAPEAVIAAIHPDDRPRVAASIRRLVASGVTQVVDHRISRPGGERRYLRLTVAFGERRGEQPDHRVGVVQDLTESRHAEREVAAHVAVAEALVDWHDLDSGAHELMAQLALALDCLAGIFWIPVDDVLVPRVFWHGESVTADRPEVGALPRGVGLPGRAWDAALPLSLPAADAIDGAPAQPSPLDGLTGALAIPAVDGQAVLAIVELRADREIVLGERLTRSLWGISHELGHFLARRGGELAAPLLTPREIEVLQLAAEGLSARRTADRLTVSPTTVRTHLENIYAKLDVSDKSSAVATAMRLGLVH
jgi:DNA-binding CsgD family transcriptional regulator